MVWGYRPFETSEPRDAVFLRNSGVPAFFSSVPSPSSASRRLCASFPRAAAQKEAAGTNYVAPAAVHMCLPDASSRPVRCLLPPTANDRHQGQGPGQQEGQRSGLGHHGKSGLVIVHHSPDRPGADVEAPSATTWATLVAPCSVASAQKVAYDSSTPWFAPSTLA